MSKKTLFIVILKIFGIVFAYKTIPQLFYTIQCLFLNSFEELFWAIFLSNFALLSLYGIIVWVFLFKPFWLINTFKLEKDISEERININYSLRDIVSIALIITGCLLLISSLPNVVRYTIESLQNKIMFREDKNFSLIISEIIKIILSLLLIFKHKYFAIFLYKQTEQKIK